MQPAAPSTRTSRESHHRGRRRALFAAVAVVVAAIGVELAARVVLHLWPGRSLQFAVVGRDLDTNWLDLLTDDLSAPQTAESLYTTDPELFWALRPNVALTIDNVVYETRDEPVRWTVTTSSDGHRGAAAAADASPLILAFGDSCTFGFRVDDDATYPAALERHLRGNGAPRADVVNHGVPGYTSFQGRVQLERVLAQARPDVVLIAYGANDREPDRHADKDKALRLRPARVRLAQLLDRLATARLLRRLLALGGDDGYGTAADGGMGSDGPSGALTERVAPADYEANLRAMVGSAQAAGARVILLDMVFVGPLYRDIIERVATELDVDWIDGRLALRQALAAMRAEERYLVDRYRIDQFWRRVVRYRLVYFDQAVYDELYADPEWKELLRYFLVEPVHANALGNRVIAERVAEVLATPRP